MLLIFTIIWHIFKTEEDKWIKFGLTDCARNILSLPLKNQCYNQMHIPDQ